MIALVLVSPERAEYLINDIEAAGLERTMMPFVAANAACSDAAAGCGVFDLFVVDRVQNAARRSIFRRGLGYLERKVPSSAGSAAHRFVRSLEWRLRVVGRIGRLAEPSRNRRLARQFPERLTDRLDEVRTGHSVSEVWVYDAWVLPQVIDAFGQTARIVIR